MVENLDIKVDDYFQKVEELKNNGFEMMVDLTAVDWFRKKEPRFELVVNFLSVSKNKRVCIKVKLTDELSIPQLQVYIQVQIFMKEKCLICLELILKTTQT